MLISTLAFACMNVSVKYLVNVNAFQIVFFRSITTLFLTMGFLLHHKIPLLGNKRKLLIFRGIAGVTSMSLFFMAIKYMPVATAVSLRYLAPILTAVFAIIFLKEKIKPLQWVFITMAFLGVLVLKGIDTQMNTLGLVLILTAAVFSALVYVTINKIGKSDHPVVVVNYFMFIATLVGGILSIFNWKTPEGIEWVLLGGLGLFGFVGQYFMTKAFQTAAASQVAPLKYIEVLFTLLLGSFLLPEIYTFWTFVGIGLIIGGLILNVIYKERHK